MERYAEKLGVSGILLNQDKVLLLKRYNTGYCDGMYGLPGGHVEAHELYDKALIREVEEEIGVTPLKYSAYKIRRDPKASYIHILYIITSWEGEPINAEHDKCSEIGWYSLNSLPINVIDYIKRALESLNSGNNDLLELFE